MRQCCRGFEQITARGILRWRHGPSRDDRKRGSGACLDLRHVAPVHNEGGREVGKGLGEVMEKRRGTSTSLYLGERRVGIMRRPDAMPDLAGGERGRVLVTILVLNHRSIYQCVYKTDRSSKRESSKHLSSPRHFWVRLNSCPSNLIQSCS